MIGSNVKRLAIHRMSLDAIPVGGGVVDGMRFLSDPRKIASSFRESLAWAEAAIIAVRHAAEPNPWKTSDDEAIAGEILRQIEKRKQEQRDVMSCDRPRR